MCTERKALFFFFNTAAVPVFFFFLSVLVFFACFFFNSFFFICSFFCLASLIPPYFSCPTLLYLSPSPSSLTIRLPASPLSLNKTNKKKTLGSSSCVCVFDGNILFRLFTPFLLLFFFSFATLLALPFYFWYVTCYVDVRACVRVCVLQWWFLIIFIHSLPQSVFLVSIFLSSRQLWSTANFSLLFFLLCCLTFFFFFSLLASRWQRFFWSHYAF